MVRSASPIPGPVGPHTVPHARHVKLHRARAPHSGLPVLRKGAHGKHVRWVQVLLNQKGAYPPLKQDGVFGPKTIAAVVNLQQSNGLAPDGVVGIQTWMNIAVNTDSTPQSILSVAVGSSVAVTGPPKISTPPPVSDWSLTRRFEEVLKLVPNHLEPELAAQFRAMLTPLNIGIFAGTLAALAISQAFGVGEIADVVLLGAGVIFIGMAVFKAAEDIYECVMTTLHAESQADLDRAADDLAQAVAILGVVAFFALLGKLTSKFGGEASAAEEETAGTASADGAGELTEPPPKPPDEPVSASGRPEDNGAQTDTSATSDESPEEQPTPEDADLASSPGESPAQIAARQKVAQSFYKNAGMSPEDIDSHLAGIDVKQPVKVVSIPPDGGGPNGNQLWQWSTPGKTGQYFSTDPAMTPDQLGTAPNVAVDGQVVPRVQNSFTATQPVTGLQSTAAPIVDTWSVGGQATQTSGGATQIFVPKGNQAGLGQ